MLRTKTKTTMNSNLITNSFYLIILKCNYMLRKYDRRKDLLEIALMNEFMDKHGAPSTWTPDVLEKFRSEWDNIQNLV